ncbi:right-handed parallel beta-helix repeat-containing protein [Catenulispora pinistramenti]|uniref:right-handed parallel beta-helix repeat-containing protein n=1 Tax=Catenulispora pinistramenti TaxID=2705254 RepID=UPI001E2E4150|nr:right-handed parallel beta-helix repeat-containing protein [Catenulispora pinistramenti]
MPDTPQTSITTLIATAPNIKRDASRNEPAQTESAPEVVLPPGVYTEHVVLGGPVSLIPRDGPGTVVISVTEGTALIVRADAVLRGIVIVSGDAGLPAVSVEATSPLFEHCEIRGARIETTGDASPTLRHCTISGAVSAGLLARGRNRPHLRDCLFDGIAAEERARPLIRLTTIARPADAGFRVVGDAQADIVRSWVVDSAGPGLLVDDRAAVRLRSCRIVNAATDGLRIDGNAALKDRRLPFDEPTPPRRHHGRPDCAVTGAGAEGVVATGAAPRPATATPPCTTAASPKPATASC